jgi:hypothetical protein
LWQAITAAEDFKVYPAVLVLFLEVVFADELFGDVGDFDADIFRIFHWHVQVEVF